MLNDDVIKAENLALLIDTATVIMEEHNDNIKKINILKNHKTSKHAKAMSVLDKRISKYLKAIRQEQEKINKFKKISFQLGLELPDTKKSPELFKETVSVVNESTGESVTLTEEELENLKLLADD